MKEAKTKIKRIRAREILDSRGKPTVEVGLTTNLAEFFASSPSGFSKGKYEAKELRDKEKRYCGMGVLKAIKNINEIIAPKLIGKNPLNQEEIDNLIIEIDGTKNKSKLGTNATLPVSMTVCRAGAAAKNISLHKYINEISNFNFKSKTLNFPKPCFNIINGGAHAGNNLDFQEFMVVPHFEKLSKNIQAGAEIYQELKNIIKKQYGCQAINLGDEGGFCPPMQTPNEALDLIIKAINNLNYKNKVKIILDVAASQFFDQGVYKMKIGTFSRNGLLNYYLDLIKNYPILGLEDPFFEDDFKGWKSLKNKEILIIGDDLLATNPERMKIAKEKNICNAAIIKPNQIGTISETINAIKIAKSYGWKTIISHRSGETCDNFIADLAVGVNSDFIKAGAPARGERVAKYNRLSKIEEEFNDEK